MTYYIMMGCVALTPKIEQCKREKHKQKKFEEKKFIYSFLRLIIGFGRLFFFFCYRKWFANYIWPSILKMKTYISYAIHETHDCSLFIVHLFFVLIHSQFALKHQIRYKYAWCLSMSLCEVQKLQAHPSNAITFNESSGKNPYSYGWLVSCIE